MEAVVLVQKHLQQVANPRAYLWEYEQELIHPLPLTEC